MKKSILILLAVPFLLFSCKEVLDELASIGTFKSTFTGDVAQQFDGTAVFVHSIKINTTPNGSSLGIVLSKTSNQDELIALTLTNTSTDGIIAGTYNSDASASGSTLFAPLYSVGQESYSLPDVTLKNQVIISSVGDTIVKGSFEINLIEISSQKTVKIVGTFDALGTTEEE